MNESTINTRFREIRVEQKMSQTAFGRPVGLTLGEVKNIEYNITSIREDKIPLICNHYGIDEHWFRTGYGEKYASKSRGEEIGEIAAKAAHNRPEDAKTYFQNLYNELGETKFLLLYEIFRQVLPQYDKPLEEEES